MKILTKEVMDYMNLFEKVTHTDVKNCYIGSQGLIFIVNEGQAGKAVGRGGENVRKLTNMLNKKVKVVEYNGEPSRFVSNLIFPMRAKVWKENDTIIIEGKGPKFKQVVLGPERKHLKELQDVVSHYFDVEIKVQ